MVIKASLILVLLSILSDHYKAHTEFDDQNNHNNDANLSSIMFSNHLSFNAVPSSRSSCCNTTKRSSESIKQAILHKGEDGDAAITAKPHGQSVKLHLKRWPVNQETKSKASAFDSTARDLARIQILHRRITGKNNQNIMSRPQKGREQPGSSVTSFSGNLIATIKSGSSLRSGEYLMDVFVGTPPRVFSLILDTGSDLNWIQCAPCYDCFEQNGPHYDPNDSSSFRHINCHDPYCQLVSPPDPHRHCNAENQTCPYFYWYGDGSNTTGDFALEKFTVNLSDPSGRQNFKQVDIMFGCGHWNRGMFHGADGLLGLGRGPLSFSSQLQSIYGHSFSYCLVNINSNTSISSKLIFGENKELLNDPNLHFTSLITGKENLDDTFYYLQIKSIMVGGEVLEIPEKVWDFSSEGAGGTIIDSGTTLTFFANPAYNIIREAFREKIKGLPIELDTTILDLCYNASGVQQIDVPDFGIIFADGAVWNFPAENYFYQYETEGVVCLAILEIPHSGLSILGNYLQQNFHLVYDTSRSRLGFSPAECAEL